MGLYTPRNGRPDHLKVEVRGETRFFSGHASLIDFIGGELGADVSEALSNQDNGMIPVAEIHKHCDGECDASMMFLEDIRRIAQDAMDELDGILKQNLTKQKLIEAIRRVRDGIYNNL